MDALDQFANAALPSTPSIWDTAEMMAATINPLYLQSVRFSSLALLAGDELRFRGVHGCHKNPNAALVRHIARIES
jgi:hypothetical protein